MEGSGIEVFMQRGDWDNAILACKSALQVTPTNARLHGYLGMCLFRKGDYLAALEPFRRATLLDDKFWEAGARLAQCYDRLHRYEEAYSVAKEFSRINPNNATLQGLVHGLENQVRGNRVEGWERTRHLSHEVQFSSE